MGLGLSCQGDDYDLLDESFESLFMRSFHIPDNVKTTLRSVSFNGRDSEPAIVKAFGSGKLIIGGSLSFNREEIDPFHLETMISLTSPTSEKDAKPIGFTESRFKPSRKRTAVGAQSPKHEAAVKLQKVYKSFRTRRQLADCAVLVEQRWWKLLDFALLKRSSVSFFDIEKPESAISRWSRARTRAAKVGKGLSKDEKAQKLALQHWLEAIDPRHRYGHNLHYYYDCWLHCESKQPFFYWLDVGEGKEVSLEEHCPRSKLQQQCIKYLGPIEREAYEVIVEDGKFMYRGSRQLLDTSGGPKDAKWIFVLSTSKTLYVGQKKKGTFQHSSFLAGGATSAAGRLIVENGILRAVWPHSGHYRPTEENFLELMSFLKENNVNLIDVKLSPTEDEEDFCSRLRSSHSIFIKPEEEMEYSHASCGTEDTITSERRSLLEASGGTHPTSFSTESKLKEESLREESPKLELPDKLQKKVLKDPEESEEEEDINEPATLSSSENDETLKVSTSDRHFEYRKSNLFAEEQGEEEEPSVPPELILHRINSKKETKSYQLGKQLSCKWTTGAGPRIGCVRDYPSELQVRSLEQVNLSPRSGGPSRSTSLRNIGSPHTKQTHLHQNKSCKSNNTHLAVLDGGEKVL
ncbi:IQ domain-containing protein IQM2-like [Typha latifolia]|uniref:IQ domain-containing protein IQM2-like n=1 Tax=Typha latifolia TaxID=4733 RepID=UPI003C2D5A37